MATPNRLDLKEATVKLIDGTGTPKELEIIFDEGNITWTEERNIEYQTNRGKLDTASVREGDEVPCQVTIEGRFNALRSVSGEDVTIREFLTKTYEASAFVTTGNECEPYAVDIQVTVDRTCSSLTTPDEIWTFSEFRHESISIDARAGTISVTGRTKEVRPTSVRTAV